jgi:hypothetical protein
VNDNGPEIIDIGAIGWTEVTGNWPGQVRAGEPAVRYKAIRLDSPVVPAGQLVEYEAGHVEAPHSHPESEIFYVIAGEFTIGDRHLPTGALAYIAGGTVYGPSIAGPAGTRFLRLHLEG